MIHEVNNSAWYFTRTFNESKYGPLRKSGVYALINIVNNKQYIGSSVNIQSRCCDHLWALRRGIHDNSYLQRAWDKYGEDSFVITALEFVETDQVEQRENYWIKNTTDIYNIAMVAGRPPGTLGYHHRPDSIEKMRARKGEKRSPEVIEIYRDSQQKRRKRERELEIELGHKIPLTEPQLKHIENLRQFHTGAKRGPETGQKLSPIQKGSKRTGQALENIRLGNKLHHKPHPQTEETKKKISVANTGKRRSGVALENIRAGIRKFRQKDANL